MLRWIAPLILASVAHSQVLPSEAVVFRRDFVSASAQSGSRIEFFWAKPFVVAPDKKIPLLVYLHGHQSDEIAAQGGDSANAGGFSISPQRMMNAVRSGYAIVAVSQPGYGASDGPPDFFGPRSQDAVQQVLKYFRALPWVDPQRIALVGISRGASLAALVAYQEPSLKSLVAIAGTYNLQTALNNQRYPKIVHNILQEVSAHPTPDQIRTRSPLLVGGKIFAQTLILHGKNDDRASSAQEATKFGEKLRGEGTPTDIKILENKDHFAAKFDDELVQSFLRKSLQIQ